MNLAFLSIVGQLQQERWRVPHIGLASKLSGWAFSLENGSGFEPRSPIPLTSTLATRLVFKNSIYTKWVPPLLAPLSVSGWGTNHHLPKEWANWAFPKRTTLLTKAARWPLTANPRLIHVPNSGLQVEHFKQEKDAISYIPLSLTFLNLLG